MRAIALVISCGLIWSSLQAAAPAQDRIRIAYPSGMNGQIPLVMQRAGLDVRNGLEGEFTPFQYGPPMMEALAAGSVDAVVLGFMPLTTYASRVPDDVRLVAYLGESSLALVVPNGSPIQALADLKGRRVAVSFNSDEYLELVVAARQQGIDAKKEFVLLNTPPVELPLALSNGTADAVMIRQPQLQRLQRDLGARVVQRWPLRFLSIVRTRFLSEKPDAVRRYRAALQDSIAFIAREPEKASAWFSEQIRVDPSIVRAVRQEEKGDVATGAAPDIDLKPPVEAALRKWFEDAFDNGIIKRRVDVTKILP
jgi:ABC-type nitrate/sulfonate/bicarbonate transport system substrate-binding protein